MEMVGVGAADWDWDEGRGELEDAAVASGMAVGESILGI